MLRAVIDAPVRAYQVRIKDEYLEDLYQYDAGSAEQEIFAKAKEGLICVMTDRPENIFRKFGNAVESVTYMGPMVELPDWFEGYANHSAAEKSRKSREPRREKVPAGVLHGVRAYGVRARAFMIRATLWVVFPFLYIGSLARKAVPVRAVRAARTGEDG